LSVQADPKILFDAPINERVDRALALLGVEPGSLSESAGHA
jgi:putative transcriptional regulator